MVSTTMLAGDITVVVRAADTSSVLTTLRAFVTNQRNGSVEVKDGRIEFDVPAGARKALYVSRANSEADGGPSFPVIPLHRPGLVGIQADWDAFGEGEVELLIQFFEGGSVSRSRGVESAEGEPVWFAPPPSTDGLGLVLILEGAGELEVHHLEVIVPPPQGWMPSGAALAHSLELVRFPEGETAWIETPTADVVGDRRIRIGDVELSMRSPIDWKAGSRENRTFQLALHGFNFADAALAAGPESATWMADVYDDWMQAHPMRPHSTTEMAWNDMAVASRTVALLRVIDNLRSIDPGRTGQLAVIAEKHAHWLAQDRNYMRGHDHGLYTDTALEYAARSLASHTLSGRWLTRARERMAATSQVVVCGQEGSVLEHSPAYVEKVAELFAHRQRNGLRDGPSLRVMDRFEETLSIATTANGRLLPWGDTGHGHLSNRKRPMGVFALTETGWGVSQRVRETAALSASYHSSSHKHGDDLSFVFYDSSGPIVTEAGFPGYGYQDDEFRAYGTSERAHNAVILNGEVADWRSNRPYGSALWAADANDEWHLLGGWNPMQSAGSHMRFLLHGDGLLVVADLLTGADIHTVERILHLDESLELVKVDASKIEFEGWTLTNWTELESSEVELLTEDDATRHFPAPGASSSHQVVQLRDKYPGLRVLTIARPEAAADVVGSKVVGTEAEIRIVLEMAEGESISWRVKDAWSKTGARLELGGAGA